MRITIICIIITALFIYFIPPCYAIDLDSTKLVDNIIKSLDEERDQWIIRGTDMFYINGHIDSDLRNETWPELDDDCLVEITYYVFKTDTSKCFVKIEKPVELNLNDNDEIRMIQKIRQVVYEELHNRYNTRMPKKVIKLKEVPKPVEKKVEVDSDGMTNL